MVVNIWIVSNGEPLPIDEGAPRLRRMGMLAKLLQSRGHEVHWFCSTFHHYKRTQRREADADVLVAPGYTIHLLHTPGYGPGVSMARMRHQVYLADAFSKKAATMEKPDLILATLAPLPLSKAAVDLAVSLGVPSVVDIRDLWPEIYRDVVPGFMKPFIGMYITRVRMELAVTLKKATGLMGVTPYFLQYGLSLAERHIGPTDGVFHTSYPAIDIPAARARFPADWHGKGLHDDDFLVVFLGTFSRQFAITPVIQAAEALQDDPRIRFVLCGSGVQLDELKADAAHLDNVLFPGWIDEAAIHSLLAVASVGVAPYVPSVNFVYNTPNKFGEYLSASLPVLVSIPGSMAGLLEEYQCGRMYHDGKELADQIKILAADPEKLAAKRAGARRLFQDRFDAGIVMDRMATYLEKVAAATSSR
jgi:glycosyltransferase involved in cell wall biosynthesis